MTCSSPPASFVGTRQCANLVRVKRLEEFPIMKATPFSGINGSASCRELIGNGRILPDSVSSGQSAEAIDDRPVEVEGQSVLSRGLLHMVDDHGICGLWWRNAIGLAA